jgi:integrase
VAWTAIEQRAPRMAATMAAYLDQLAVSSRPATVSAASLVLRQFADHLTSIDSDCVAVALVERRHIEDYKLALAARPGRDGGTVTTETIRNNLGMLRSFFERLIDWDHPDAPRRVPVLAGDIPKANEPLPKFLDDPTAAKFMAALAVEPNRRRRLIVELLARTGMRVGEIGGLRDDAMYRLGDTWWLRIPLGKLHNERSVPLHPMLVGLIADYQAWRGPTATGLLVERNDHQPMDPRTIYRHVQAVARRAGVRVHPHALRHTLATQCINRGMSLEAIAALLGHRSPRMTLVYARISDTTVAEQYFTATSAVEAEADTPIATSAADAATVSLHRRLLGNGHCTRPLELDCRFQTICEGCGFYDTGPEFVTILRRQRDDAAAHTDLARTHLYDRLIDVIDDADNYPQRKPGPTIA